MPDANLTTRAYTAKLSGNGQWRDLLWRTHVTANRATQVWGDWLLTLRGGLPASLADDHPERRVLIALSWLSVECPASLAPKKHIVACGTDDASVRRSKVMSRFDQLLKRLNVGDEKGWCDAAETTLTARIRDDAVWVDRSAAFAEAVSCMSSTLGLTEIWDLLGRFLGTVESYFKLPKQSDDSLGSAEDQTRELIKEAMGWLSNRFGKDGKGADFQALSQSYGRLADISQRINATSGSALIEGIAREFNVIPTLEAVLSCFGASGHKSATRNKLKLLGIATAITSDQTKHLSSVAQSDCEKCRKSVGRKSRQAWASEIMTDVERRSGFTYQPSSSVKPHRDQCSVVLDHAARRVKITNSWIKRAEVERQQFQADASKLEDTNHVPTVARQWLDDFRERQFEESGSLDDYLIRKRAIDGWDKIVQAWTALGTESTRGQRIEAARDVQANLDDNEKFGDIQLFAGYGDENSSEPRKCLADDDAFCVWHDADGQPTGDILKNYVAATVAEHNQRRFKVPAYRHPDPLRHPVYVDYGDSRWGIAYSALEAYQDRAKWKEQLSRAKTDQIRAKLRQQIDITPDLCGVTLDLWDGERVSRHPLRWHGMRLWHDLGLEQFGRTDHTRSVSRADRLGRLVAAQSPDGAVTVAEVFQQNDWNGRLQVPREQLDRLADVVYGKINDKRVEPDYAKLEGIQEDPHALKHWQRLNWFITTSAKLKPQGPWLDYVDAGLPADIDYKKGRSGYYLDYAANKDRKSRARLKLARLPGLRVLSFDLGHRYAAACAVWETLSSTQMAAACKAAGRPMPTREELYVHLRRETEKRQRSGREKGRPITETTVYRRIGPDMLPDGSIHPAPWARLERQFLVKLQGEDRPVRNASPEEIAAVNEFRRFAGFPEIGDAPPIDELQKDAVRAARLGLRRLGDAARVAFALTATTKPVSGGRDVGLAPEQRIQYLQDALVWWQQLASTNKRGWAATAWQSWIVEKFAGPQPVEIVETITRAQQKKRVDALREQLSAVARHLADVRDENVQQLHGLWCVEWKRLEAEWKQHLRWLRRFVLPRSKNFAQDKERIRRVGGLSVQRLQTIRNLYQVLKAFRMRPDPADLRKNIPAPGDEALAKFGRRILNQLERLREQRIKQLASRVIEAAIGAGRMKTPPGIDRPRHVAMVDRPCHVVVAENLERYKPEDSRLRRENRQLMDWAARNLRKFVVEGCELHGLHFVEVSPAYTSRQDSRTGTPGIRCEDVDRKILEEAVRRARSTNSGANNVQDGMPETQFERDVRRWLSQLRRLKDQKVDELSWRDRVLKSAVEAIRGLPASHSTVRLPKRGGELFVSADGRSRHGGALQADLNAAANIGLKAIMDPDWFGAWWFMLVNLATGQPVAEKIHGCPIWSAAETLLPPAVTSDGTSGTKRDAQAGKSQKRQRLDVYAWNPMYWKDGHVTKWQSTAIYWASVEKAVAEQLQRHMTERETPF